MSLSLNTTHMSTKTTTKYAVLHSLGTALYVALVGFSMYNANHFFGPVDTVVTPIAILLLLVVSVAIVGLLIFCRPVLWYLDGHKKAAVHLVVCTVGLLVVYTAVALTILAASSHRVTMPK